MRKSQPSLKYGDNDLQEFKAIILSRMEVADSEIKKLKESLNESADMIDKKWDEDGASSWEIEYLTEQINRAVKFKAQLENALLRIHNKSYGICRLTGKLIDKNRLRLVPHTTLSIEAKLKNE